MKNKFAIFVLPALLGFASCVPNYEKELLPTEYQQESTDSIPTITLSSDSSTNDFSISQHYMTLHLYSDKVEVEGLNIDAKYTMIPKQIVIRLDNYGKLIYLKANTSELYKEVTNTNYRYYDATNVQVRKGQTAAKIAADHQISLRELQALNPGIDIDKLKVGQSLKVY